jgi:TPR repeat protein
VETVDDAIGEIVADANSESEGTQEVIEPEVELADESVQIASNATIIEETSAEEIAELARIAELEKGIRAYYDGNYNTSFELLYPLAEEGEARAQFRIGVMYRYGRSVSKNSDLSEKWFTLALPTVLRRAQTGDAWAQTDLGTAYEIGISLTQDFERAAYWYRLAAEQNYPGAQTNLGVLYANGEGVSYNRSKAVFWLKKAASQGDLVALQNLSVMGEKL